MSTFTVKSGNDAKSNTLGSMNRQHVIQETSKRRSFLNDNSWIKSRPEEEEEERIKDQNFGRVILNRHKSQEDLERENDQEDMKAVHNRFKSDDALDRIPLRNTSEKGNKSATLERIPMSGQDTTNKSRQSFSPSDKTTTTTITEDSKRKSWGQTNKGTTTTTTTTTSTDNTPKSWGPTNKGTTTTTTTTTTSTDNKPAVPGKPEGQKITIYSSDNRTTEKPARTSFIDNARSRFEKTEEKSSVPTSPPAKYDSRTEEKIKQAPLSPLSPTAKTDNRPPFPLKPVIQESGERRTSVERKQRSKDLDNLIEVSNTKVVNNKGDQVDLIDISDTAKNTPKREEEIKNLIEIKKPATNTRNQSFDNVIEIKNTTNKTKGNEGLDDLIAITGDNNKGIPKSPINSTSNTTRSSTTTTTYNVTHESSDIPGRRSTTSRTYNVNNDFEDLSGRSSSSTATYKVTDDYLDAPSRHSSTSTNYKVTEGSNDAPNRRSTTSTTYRDTIDGSSNVRIIEGANTRPNSTYSQESRTSSSYSYDQPIVSNSIKTVYSTSDRSVIEKDQCTYCRKPLGIEAKMILKDLNISCHATCFKCEACSGSLENLKAGDSMWIYKNTIHCEPCYFSVREKWII